MNDIFKIFKLDTKQAEEIIKEPNLPHSHDYEELLIGIEGQVEHFIDFQPHIIDAPFVSFITQGKMHQIKPMAKNGKCEIWAIRFRSELISATAFQLYTAFHDNANIHMNPDTCFSRLDDICAIIYDEYIQESPDIAVIRQLLMSVFTIIESERKKLRLNYEESKKIQSVTFKNFLRILEEHYREPKDVSFYAEKLFMTTRNLNLICQDILHQSVSEIIENRKLIEAKNQLISTDKTIAEIGYDIGFKEKTYFTHTFKRKTGVTPSEFRKEVSKLFS
ncbi:MAG: helix-turn-helix domain-containing protein [Dysgonomonas sp.]